ncbi:hypothetical protein SAMN05444007_103399 [Cribrihabitans marinus]|uniref:Uncharacterized protein n=1 Tax=Cribrihabitans marinus TaxID=1227549 RepID=A0A1H6WCU1_9RHOB|nr:hypothetical protein [Cribrihabitans marinus]GGH24422.1 hypothetical protein GCM10010973_10910 [Cribrihabitans marinus]SEJ13526.1 hypothetical protein SAMN05444007_103399 [Cribrihabitans marinus]
MIEAGISVGVCEDEFWLMTPRQYWRRLKGEGGRLKRENEARIEQVWLGEVLHRVKKVPKLEKLLGKEKPEKVSISEGFARIREMAMKAKQAREAETK